MDQIEQVPGSPLREVAPPQLAIHVTSDGGALLVPVAEAELPRYVLVQDQPAGADARPRPPVMLESWTRWPDGSGAINAVARAAYLSLTGEPVTVLRPGQDGEPSLVMLARFVGGARAGRTRPLRAPVREVD